MGTTSFCIAAGLCTGSSDVGNDDPGCSSTDIICLRLEMILVVWRALEQFNFLFEGDAVNVKIVGT